MEYQLDTSLDRAKWDTLDAFTQGYIEAAMWTLTVTWYECAACGFESRETVDCPNCGSIDGLMREHTDSADYLGLHDITASCLQTMIEDCRAFQDTYREDLDEATDENKHWQAEERHGHDFWLTRNGHGCGFWDRGYSEPLSTTLTNAAKNEGSADLYVGDDGFVYHG